jgi:outer membrane lipopolysaccharide assembly protein LptE/RlpB
VTQRAATRIAPLLMAALSLLLAACGHQPDTATRDAVKAPIDKAEAVQETVDAQAEANRAALEQLTGDAPADAPAEAPTTTPP